ncbi:MAG: peptidylprolyl isomerase [Thermodesulfovibrio sp.]|nr:peptidylprolyl isomerase [Thermodesulfovibrio sp.]
MMKRILIAIIVLAALAACNKKPAEPKAEKGAVLAKVGAAVITEGDLERELKSLPDYAQQMFSDEKGKEKFVEELVKKEMLYQEAVKKGLDKSADFVKKVEEFKKLTLVSELLEKEIMARTKVSDQEAKEYYEKHKEEFVTTSQIKASHILVKTEDEAVNVLARLKKGEKFEEIAKKDSLDKGSAKSGGDLGFFARGQMVPEFEKAAAELKPGEISKPVKSNYGFHIIKVTDKKTGPVIEYDRIKDLISQKLSGERQKESFDKYVTELKKTYTVEIMKDALAKPKEGAKEGPKESNAKATADKPAAEKKDAPKKDETPKKEEARPKAH